MDMKEEEIIPRFYYQSLGIRRTQDGRRETGREVLDAWTGNVIKVHWSESPVMAEKMAQNHCAVLNAPMLSLAFDTSLIQFMDDAEAAGHPAGDIVEDLYMITRWHHRRLTGQTRDPLDTRLLLIPTSLFDDDK